MVVAAHLQDSVLVPDVVDLAVLERGIIAVHQIIEGLERGYARAFAVPSAYASERDQRVASIGFLYEESADWDPLKKSRRAPVSIL